MSTILSRHREFLLGLLQPEQVDALEEEYFPDDALFVELVEEESSLICDYRLRRLGPELRERFEVYYLASDPRREELALHSGIEDLVKRICREVKTEEGATSTEGAPTLRERASPEEALTSAFTRFVLPLLPMPPQLVARQTLADTAKPVLLALFAYSMLLQRVSNRSSVHVFEWSDQGLRSQGALVCRSAIIEAEIRSVAIVSDQTATSLLKWIFEALRVHADLVPGIKAQISSKGILNLRVEHNGPVRTQEIVGRWRRVFEERAATDDQLNAQLV